MKKYLPGAILLLCGVIAGVIISSALFVFSGFSVFSGVRKEPSQPDSVNNAALTALSYDVLENIKIGDYAALAGMSHPEYGVVFSPSATVTLLTNRRFSPDQIAYFANDSSVYVWGVRSGSDEPIEMTPLDYISEYVFDKDYTEASIVGVNRIVRSGNALENIEEVFIDVQYVDFHIAGGEKDSADDMGWSSLRLGFEDYEGALRLVVVVHSAWSE